jgi:Domain of unknown function (DUF5916)
MRTQNSATFSGAAASKCIRFPVLPKSRPRAPLAHTLAVPAGLGEHLYLRGLVNKTGLVRFCLLIALLAWSVTAWAQDPPAARRVMTAVPLEEGDRITLDGVLDENVWQRAVPATDFIQQDPSFGQPATERTEVRIAFDDRRLYMGVTCFDSEPDKLLGFQRRRDEFLGSDDRFQWTMDTFLTGREGYFFEMNPSGLMADALLTPGGGQSREWDGIWNARVRRSEIGWVIEIEIPFQTLNFDPNASAWGINFQRSVRRKNEESLWTGYARNQGLRRMSNAGLLEGIHEVSQGHGFDIKPYATGSASSGLALSHTVYKGNFGGEFSYTPTPRLRASVTINTDFAQTEVDQRQVNLGRFSLFFPEKRDFFLEGAGYFDFRSNTGGGPRLRPYFSRQIGLNPEDHSPQPIVYGARIAGQIGKQDVGILQVRTGEDTIIDDDFNLVPVPSEDFTVVRLKRRMLSQSFIGGLFTRRAPRHGGQALNTLGLDMLLDTANFRGSKNLRLDGFLLGATRPAGTTGGNLAYGANLSYPNDPWEASFDFRDVQEDFDAAVGDVQRTDYRRYTPKVTWTPRPRESRWVRNYAFEAELGFLTDRENKMLSRDFNFKVFEVQLQSQDRLTFEVKPQYERIRDGESAEISNIELLGREFTFTRYEISMNTAARRTISVSPSVEWGPFYSGTRQSYNLNLNLRIRPGLLMYNTFQYNKINLAEGRTQTRLIRISPEWQMSPFMYLVNSIQYDSVSRVLGWQARFRWILQPGNDFYFVYSHNWIDCVGPDGPDLCRQYSLPIGHATVARNISTKLVYTRRF